MMKMFLSCHIRHETLCKLLNTECLCNCLLMAIVDNACRYKAVKNIIQFKKYFQDVTLIVYTLRRHGAQ